MHSDGLPETDSGYPADDAAPVSAAAPIGAVAAEAPGWIAAAAALIAGTLAIAVIAGWQFGLTLLTAASPGGYAMPPLTALGILLAAASLLLVHPSPIGGTRRGFGDVLAGLVCALGIAVLVEYTLRVDLGFDLLLYPGRIADTDVAFPGRPSMPSAAIFTLLGVALLALGGGGWRVRTAQWLGLVAFLIGAAVLLGYLYRIPELYAPPGSAPMPMHASIALVVLSLGLLFARRRYGLMGTVTARDVGGLTARRLMPIGVLLPVLLGALIAEAVRAGALPAAHGLFLVGSVLSVAFAALVWRSALVLRRIDRERRNAARGLVQSEQRFRSLAENASDAMITIDGRGSIVFANPAAERLFGYTAEELAGLRFTDLMPERYRAAHREATQRYERSGRRRIDWGGAQFMGLRRDGREVPLEITLGEYIRDERRYYTGIMRDITERKHAETSQRLLVEAGRVLSASLDPAATLRGVARLTVAELADWCVVYGGDEGLSPIELAARDLVREVRLGELERTYPPRAPSPVVDAIRTGEPQLIADVTPERLEALAHGGSQHLELITEVGCRSLLVVPLLTRGRTIGALSLGADGSGHYFDERDLATARELAVRIAFAVDNARLYEEARAARAQAESRALELERMTESRARLMRGFSHDLKNPLGAAEGHADLMESGVLGVLQPKQRESVGSIRRTIRDALGLIDDLVELARAETAQLELRVGEVPVGRIVRDVVDEQRPRAEAKGLALGVDDRPMPAIADGARVRQIVANLVTNAIKYTDDGSVTVRVSDDARGAPGPGGWLRVDVEDTGPGIPEDQQARMFEEFARLAHDVPGSGLGLAISRNLAEAMGGALTVRSAPGQGACFTLWLKGGAERRAVAREARAQSSAVSEA